MARRLGGGGGGSISDLIERSTDAINKGSVLNPLYIPQTNAVNQSTASFTATAAGFTTAMATARTQSKVDSIAMGALIIIAIRAAVDRSADMTITSIAAIVAAIDRSAMGHSLWRWRDWQRTRRLDQ